MERWNTLDNTLVANDNYDGDVRSTLVLSITTPDNTKCGYTPATTTHAYNYIVKLDTDDFALCRDPRDSCGAGGVLSDSEPWPPRRACRSSRAPSANVIDCALQGAATVALGEGPATFSSSNDDNINLSEDAVRIEMPPHAPVYTDERALQTVPSPNFLGVHLFRSLLKHLFV